ncbi:hypothetical protein ACLOJK_037127, partial [Asimina triloba]
VHELGCTTGAPIWCSITLTKAGSHGCRRRAPARCADARSNSAKMTTTTRGFRSLYLLRPSMHISHKNQKYKDSSSSPTTVHTQIRRPPAANRPPSATMAAPSCSMRPTSSSPPPICVGEQLTTHPLQQPPSSATAFAVHHQASTPGPAATNDPSKAVPPHLHPGSIEPITMVVLLRRRPATSLQQFTTPPPARTIPHLDGHHQPPPTKPIYLFVRSAKIRWPRSIRAASNGQITASIDRPHHVRNPAPIPATLQAF